MVNLIILKILPTQPTEAVPFRNAIQGLRVTAYDLTIDDNINGLEIGKASGVPEPSLDDLNIIYEEIPMLEKSIIQSFDFGDLDPAPELGALQSVATAIIVVVPPHGKANYRLPNSFDLRFTIEYDGIDLMDSTIEYNATVLLVDALFTKQWEYMQQPATSFYSIPVSVLQKSSVAYVPTNSNGLPPDFKNLVKAINSILADDGENMGPLEALTTPLTPAQCLLIAAEITWNRSLNPAPTAPSSSLESMYTIGIDPLTNKPVQPSDKENDDRSQFETNTGNYHNTLDASSHALSAFVAAASAAILCEQCSASAAYAGLTFPVEAQLSKDNSLPTTSVVLELTPTNASFIVPAIYFYALTSSYPIQFSAQQRYDAVLITKEDTLLGQLQVAVDSGLILSSESPLSISGDPVSIAQAARRLAALGLTKGYPQVLNNSVATLIDGPFGWLGYSGSTADINANFWYDAINNNGGAYLTLLLQAITQGQTALLIAIQKNLSTNVQALVNVTDLGWTKFFQPPNDILLPPFTGTGTLAQRINTFVQYLQKFFTVPSEAPSGTKSQQSAIATLGTIVDDPLQLFIAKYTTLTGGFSFETPLDPKALADAIRHVFPEDLRGRAWLKRSLETIYTLFPVTTIGGVDLQFSLMEALYSRGFTTTESINDLTSEQFQAALTGTVAYPYASKIQSVGATPTKNDDTFAPVNTGELTNCVPPRHLSPLGLVAYLHEMLALPLDDQTVGYYVSSRRGPIGSIHATLANLETPIPRIDLVNESLEALVTQTHGAVFDTQQKESLLAVPEHSSPSTFDSYKVLANCFTSPALPYHQKLDISRSYLSPVGSSLFETMRHFRKDITEFAIDDKLQPADFQSHLWRFPIKSDIAREFLHISSEEYASLFTNTLSDRACLELLGIETDKWDPDVFSVSVFLEFTGLTYGQFIELWKCGYVSFHEDKVSSFPECEPCDLKASRIRFDSAATLFCFRKLFVFIRLWRCIRGPTFKELAEICIKLNLFEQQILNDDFIRQLAAFLMLHEHLKIRKHLLALWAAKGTPAWHEALEVLLQHVELYAKTRYSCHSRGVGFRKDLKDNIHQLSILAGFTQVDSWDAKPTSALRFMEALTKVYSSNFTIDEILFLFSVKQHRDGDDPFSLPDRSESDIDPLQLPERHSVWGLRAGLMKMDIEPGASEAWTWDRIDSTLHDLGYESVAIQKLKLFFESGKFTTNLKETTSSMWNSNGPFRYESSQLSIELPLSDDSVLDKLRTTRQLTDAEINAVQDLYFAPRAVLAPFAAMFANFHHDVYHLVAAPRDKAFYFFQYMFAVFHCRCEIIADYLAQHVSAATDRECTKSVAWRVLCDLLADENFAKSDWENDSGAPPQTEWTSGNSFAALLGLVGTGLLGEFSVKGQVVWRDLTGDLSSFGKIQNETNSPITTILPSMDLQLTSQQSIFASTHNGFAIHDSNGKHLGGAQPFKVRWNGGLLVEQAGEYQFCVGYPRPDSQPPDFESAKHHQWLLTLRRGERLWTVLNHSWDAAHAPPASSDSLWLHRGIYHIEIQFKQDQPAFAHEPCIRHLNTGFQVKYTGADTGGVLMTIPIDKLFLETKHDPLSHGIHTQSVCKEFLRERYTSSLRDIRRTYQRAFKSILFVHRFNLSSSTTRHSELNYLLNHGADFTGTSYYRTHTTFHTHHAFLDFNFLPVTDFYNLQHSSDSRTHPTSKRQAALFDCWERIFDYCQLRHVVKDDHEAKNNLWELFREATVQQPTQPNHLLRYLGIDISLAKLVLNFGFESLNYIVKTADFADERWATRVWHAGIWIRNLKRFSTIKLEDAQPSLWASDPGSENLIHFFHHNFMVQPPNKEVRRINDGLRERSRTALFNYLCGKNRVSTPFGYAQSPRDLTDLLLQDVEAGLNETSTRLRDAVVATQTLIQRARLGLEAVVPTRGFIEKWDEKYVEFKVWEARKRRELYRENWIQWDDLHKSRESEAFRVLESELRRSAITIPKSGGPLFFSEGNIPGAPTLEELQVQELTSMSSQISTTGLSLLAQPENIRPTLLAPEPTDSIPLWIKTAIKLGTRFLRVAAAAIPPAVHPNITKWCAECGKSHTPVIDEFYFWLANSKRFDQTDAAQNAALGSNPPNPACEWDPDYPRSSTIPSLPLMLDWKPRPMLHLYWCRVHFGRTDNRRQSDYGLSVEKGDPSDPQLTFDYRRGDSLFFTVNLGKTGSGFRYDLATDSAVVTPEIVLPPEIDITGFPAPLHAYPYFVYFTPGAPLIPPSKFSSAIAIANTLRSHRRFEEALKWYEIAFNPLNGDNSWRQPSSSLRDRRRALMLEYVETLLQWGDTLIAQKSHEADERARVIFHVAKRILGLRPKTIDVQSKDSITVDNFQPLEAPLNSRLVTLFDHQSFAYNFDETLLSYDTSHGRQPYRFSALLSQAKELAGIVRGYGASLLSTFERGDGEYLESLRATQNRQILQLTLASRQNQFREADWEVQGLEQSLDGAMCRLTYYQNLINNGLIADENAFVTATDVSMATRSAAASGPLLSAASFAMVPDSFVGEAVALPLTFARLPTGTAEANFFSISAQILTATADVSNTIANLQLTEAGWERRLEGWQQQVAEITIELQQIERQKLAADRRRYVALHELNNQQQEIEHSIEAQDFIRDKFTSHELYLFLQQETASLFRRTYDLALEAARQTQRMFQYERQEARNFLSEAGWNSLREGLMSGERLELALQQMEQAYLTENVREYELNKNISMVTQFPEAFLQLKATGQCEFEFSEWVFDADYPGHYMRRIKSVGLTIPCVVEPYVGIHCRLELLKSSIRIDPSCFDGYDRNAEDVRFIHHYGARESIATSNGQADSGLFELNFRDNRYLPFEFAGAVSRWRIQLPPENNQFDLETLNDLVIHLSYTAREGGDHLRREANKSAQKHLPGSGWRLFDVRHEFPDAWRLFTKDGRDFSLQLNRNMFPFLTGRRQVKVVELQLFIETDGCISVGEHIKVKFYKAGHKFHEDECCETDVLEFQCVVSREWQRLYHGSIKLDLGPIGFEYDCGTLRFPKHVGEVREMYLLLRYGVEEPRGLGSCGRQSVWTHSQSNGKFY